MSRECGVAGSPFAHLATLLCCSFQFTIQSMASTLNQRTLKFIVNTAIPGVNYRYAPDLCYDRPICTA